LEILLSAKVCEDVYVEDDVVAVVVCEDRSVAEFE
jgi:hypothetical protein